MAIGECPTAGRGRPTSPRAAGYSSGEPGRPIVNVVATHGCHGPACPTGRPAARNLPSHPVIVPGPSSDGLGTTSPRGDLKALKPSWDNTLLDQPAANDLGAIDE